VFRKNTAGQFIHVQGVDATTGGIKTGVSWTVRRCIDGTFAAATGTASEDGSTGWYKFALSQADTNGNDIGFNFTGTGAVPQTVNILTTAADPSDTIRFGLTALPAVASGSAGAIPTVGTGTAQISLSAGLVQADVAKIATVAVSTATAQIGVNVVSYATGVGPLSPIRVGSCQSGSTSTTIKFDTGASSVDDFYNNCTVMTTSGTGASQARKILDYVGSTRVATVRAWVTTPAVTDFAILPDTSAWDDVTADHQTAGSTGFTLNAGGDPWSTQLPGSYLAGSAGRLVGRSLPDVVAGSANGLHINGTNVGDLNYTGITNSAVRYTGAAGVPAVLISGAGNNAVGLQIDGGLGSSTAGIVVLGQQGMSINGLAGAGINVSGTTFSINCTGAVSMTNSSNNIRLGATEEALIGVASAAAWGASVVGNGRTRDMYLQGMTNKVAFDVPGAGQYTIYASDDSTTLVTGTFATSAVDPVVRIDPT
jgi:hypothetical protein